jgi:hypothetical protein
MPSNINIGTLFKIHRFTLSYCQGYSLYLHIHFLENYVHCYSSKSFKLAVKCVDLFSDFFLSDLSNLIQDRDQRRVLMKLGNEPLGCCRAGALTKGSAQWSYQITPSLFP